MEPQVTPRAGEPVWVRPTFRAEPMTGFADCPGSPPPLTDLFPDLLTFDDCPNPNPICC